MLMINMSWSSLLKIGQVCGQFTSSKLKNHILSPFANSSWRLIIKKTNYASEVKKVDISAKTKQAKDRLLFYYENPRFYKIINIFGFVQFLFWVNTAEFFYKEVNKVQSDKQDQFYERLPSWMNIDLSNKNTRRLLSTCSFLIGYLVLVMVWMYTTRTVRMLVLRKGGDVVSMVTYTPFGGNRTYEIPLDKITAFRSRSSVKDQLPIKVQGKLFYYILDTRNGTFQNGELFDRTAGMYRTFK